MSFERGVAQTVQAVMVASADHVTPTAPTGNLAATISKAGAAFETCTNTPASVSNGLVTVLLTADETNCDYYTVRFTGTDVDEVWVVMYTEAAWTAVRAGYLVSGLSTLTAQQVWEYGTRTLTSLSALVGSIATAVWAAVARTLTSAEPPTAAAVADAVWDETQADHSAAGSMGKGLSDAGAAGDPWATELPGDYEPGTAGHRVGILLTGGGSVILQAASDTVTLDAAGGLLDIEVVRGDTHTATFTRADLALTDHTVVITCRPGPLEDLVDPADATALFTKELTVVSDTQMTLVLTPTETDLLALDPKAYWYQIKDLTQNQTILRGKLSVVGSAVKRTS